MTDASLIQLPGVQICPLSGDQNQIRLRFALDFLQKGETHGIPVGISILMVKWDLNGNLNPI
jgi:hypothetical protein